MQIDPNSFPLVLDLFVFGSYATLFFLSFDFITVICNSMLFVVFFVMIVMIICLFVPLPGDVKLKS